MVYKFRSEVREYIGDPMHDGEGGLLYPPFFMLIVTDEYSGCRWSVEPFDGRTFSEYEGGFFVDLAEAKKWEAEVETRHAEAIKVAGETGIIPAGWYEMEPCYGSSAWVQWEKGQETTPVDPEVLELLRTHDFF